MLQHIVGPNGLCDELPVFRGQLRRYDHPSGLEYGAC